MSRRIFITGNGTEVGKTVVSAILTQALGADYWKPVSAGGLDYSDSMQVADLVSHPDSVIHPECYALTQAMSPHAAAERDNVAIELNRIHAPVSNKDLIIEGAGGLLVPLNGRETVLDLIGQLGAEVVLVSRNYLGSINHTLLTVEALKERGLPIAGIIFNRAPNADSEDIIISMSGLDCLGKIEEIAISRESIATQAKRFCGVFS